MLMIPPAKSVRALTHPRNDITHTSSGRERPERTRPGQISLVIDIHVSLSLKAVELRCDMCQCDQLSCSCVDTTGIHLFGSNILENTPS